MTLRQQSRLPPSGVDALFIWPRGGNSGDQLIADACELFLRNQGIDVWRSDGSIEEAALAGDADYLGDLFADFRGMVMFNGGGNIGIYPDNAAIRAAVIERTTLQRCLVFPQSALKPEQALVNARVTVWCRDSVSESTLAPVGTRTALVPDIALYMDQAIPKRPQGSGVYYIKRTPGADLENIVPHIETGWPSADLTLSRPLDEIIATLEPYEFVITDRLHGGLIALMMRKKVVFLPVAYHKVAAFYETWLRSNRGAAFAPDPAAARAKLPFLDWPDDISQLCALHADRAFNHFLLHG
jgi:exopolysaccharide biosynthesis predicted pyruvyltransferase EpsI